MSTVILHFVVAQSNHGYSCSDCTRNMYREFCRFTACFDQLFMISGVQGCTLETINVPMQGEENRKRELR